MAKYLVTFNDQLSEIEISGFSIMTDKEVDRFEDLAASITWDFVYPIGDSEIEFSCGEDLLSRIDFREISNDEAKVLKKIFNTNFGIFITEEYLDTVIGDEKDEDLDDDGDYEDDYEKNDDYDDDY